MKFVSVRDFRIKPGTVWNNLEKNEEIIITSNGKPVALLTRVSDVTFDETLKALRRAKAELAVSRMRKASHKKGLSKLGTREIDSEIASSRKNRKQ